MSPHVQASHPISKIDNPMVKLSYPTPNHNHPTMMMTDDPLSGSKERKREIICIKKEEEEEVLEYSSLTKYYSF